MRLVVTGGAGFVGSHLVEQLLSLGHEVIVIDNLITGDADNLAHLDTHPDLEFREQDASEVWSVDGAIDGIFHLASPASPVDYLEHPVATLRVGSVATFNCLEVARAKNARFLMASTSEIYGDPLEHPQRESYWGHVNPVGPRSVYDEAKRFSEAVTMAYHRRHDVDTRIIRIFNTYGPRMRPRDGRVVSNFVIQALRGEPLTIYGDGSQTRSFCYVSDLVDGIIRAFFHGDANPVNLGNPSEFTVRQLADVVLKKTGSQSQVISLPLPEDDPRVRQPDITRARTLLGWEPSVSLDEGLDLTIEHFRALVA